MPNILDDGPCLNCGSNFHKTMDHKTFYPQKEESRINEDAMEECDHCGEFMCGCTCHELETYDGDF